MLGAMMVSEAAIDPVMGEARLSAEDFYRGRHGTIFTRHPRALRAQPSRSTR